VQRRAVKQLAAVGDDDPRSGADPSEGGGWTGMPMHAMGAPLPTCGGESAPLRGGPPPPTPLPSLRSGLGLQDRGVARLIEM